MSRLFALIQPLYDEFYVNTQTRQVSPRLGRVIRPLADTCRSFISSEQEIKSTIGTFDW